VLLDGAQRIPQGPLDLKALGVDFYVFSGHKAYGPNGIGVLWARSEILEAMPPFLGGGSMIGRVDFAGTTYAPPPRRFEAGTPPIAQAVGLGAAIAFMQKLDWAGVEAHEMGLTQRLMDGLGRIDGARIVGPRGLQGRVPVVSFIVEGIHPHDLAQILDQNGVAIRGGHHCAQPLMEHFDLSGTARASIAAYNDASDIDALLDGVALARRKLA
jgi:cysteine desulfurase/selenocysteine lyase